MVKACSPSEATSSALSSDSDVVSSMGSMCAALRVFFGQLGLICPFCLQKYHSTSFCVVDERFLWDPNVFNGALAVPSLALYGLTTDCLLNEEAVLDL